MSPQAPSQPSAKGKSREEVRPRQEDSPPVEERRPVIPMTCPLLQLSLALLRPVLQKRLLSSEKVAYLVAFLCYDATTGIIAQGYAVNTS